MNNFEQSGGDFYQKMFLIFDLDLFLPRIEGISIRLPNPEDDLKSS
jgi:hypothetical protein